MWKSYHHLLPTHSLNYLKSFWNAGVFFENINHYNSLDQQITASYIVHSVRGLPNDILVNYKLPKYRICMNVSYIFLIHRICIAIYDIRYTIYDVFVYRIHNSNHDMTRIVYEYMSYWKFDNRWMSDNHYWKYVNGYCAIAIETPSPWRL